MLLLLLFLFQLFLLLKFDFVLGWYDDLLLLFRPSTVIVVVVARRIVLRRVIIIIGKNYDITGIYGSRFLPVPNVGTDHSVRRHLRHEQRRIFLRPTSTVLERFGVAHVRHFRRRQRTSTAAAERAVAGRLGEEHRGWQDADDA